jgi:acyl carrier protein
MNPPTDPQAVAAELCQFVRTHLLAGGVAFDENRLLAEVGIDSFALVELLLHCERVFGVRVPESHLTHRNLASVRALADCIAALGRGEIPAPP